MALTDEFFTDKANSSLSTFKAYLSKAASELNVQNWDSSYLYQVKNL